MKGIATPAARIDPIVCAGSLPPGANALPIGVASATVSAPTATDTASAIKTERATTTRTAPGRPAPTSIDTYRTEAMSMPIRVPAAAMNANWVPNVTMPSAAAPVSPPPNERAIRMFAANVPMTKTPSPMMFCAVPAASTRKSLPSVPANTPVGAAATSSCASSSGSIGREVCQPGSPGTLGGDAEVVEQGRGSGHRGLVAGEAAGRAGGECLLVPIAVDPPPPLEVGPHGRVRLAGGFADESSGGVDEDVVAHRHALAALDDAGGEVEGSRVDRGAHDTGHGLGAVHRGVPDGARVPFLQERDGRRRVAGRALGGERQRRREHLELRREPRPHEQIVQVVAELAAAQLDVAGPHIDRDQERLIQPSVHGQWLGPSDRLVPPAELLEHLERR